jgi:hypothetical protein
MMMFGPRLNTVFASRWKAAFWAASVMVSAYFMVPAPSDTKPAGEPAAADTSAQEAASMVAQLTGGQAPARQAPAASPWGQ